MTSTMRPGRVILEEPVDEHNRLTLPYQPVSIPIVMAALGDFAGLICLFAIYFVGGAGATALISGTAHEFVHDGRHLSASLSLIEGML
jgi:hypothetical protein